MYAQRKLTRWYCRNSKTKMVNLPAHFWELNAPHIFAQASNASLCIRTQRLALRTRSTFSAGGIFPKRVLCKLLGLAACNGLHFPTFLTCNIHYSTWCPGSGIKPLYVEHYLILFFTRYTIKRVDPWMLVYTVVSQSGTGYLYAVRKKLTLYDVTANWWTTTLMQRKLLSYRWTKRDSASIVLARRTCTERQHIFYWRRWPACDNTGCLPPLREWDTLPSWLRCTMH